MKLLLNMIELAPEERASVQESDGGVYDLDEKQIRFRGFDPAK